MGLLVPAKAKSNPIGNTRWNGLLPIIPTDPPEPLGKGINGGIGGLPGIVYGGLYGGTVLGGVRDGGEEGGGV